MIIWRQFIIIKDQNEKIYEQDIIIDNEIMLRNKQYQEL